MFIIYFIKPFGLWCTRRYILDLDRSDGCSHKGKQCRLCKGNTRWHGYWFNTAGACCCVNVFILKERAICKWSEPIVTTIEHIPAEVINTSVQNDTTIHFVRSICWIIFTRRYSSEQPFIPSWPVFFLLPLWYPAFLMPICLYSLRKALGPRGAKLFLAVCKEKKLCWSSFHIVIQFWNPR